MPTIGVSVAVPDPWGTRLQEYRVELGDPSARLIPTHVTLIPPYEAEAGELDTVVTHLRDAARGIEPFSAHLRGTGTFRPVSPVVFVNLVEGISECELLAERLRGGPLDTGLRFPYHPHVTIAHDLDDELLDRAFTELADFDCVFEVTDFHLYEHDEYAGWQPTYSFGLGASGDAVVSDRASARAADRG